MIQMSAGHRYVFLRSKIRQAHNDAKSCKLDVPHGTPFYTITDNFLHVVSGNLSISIDPDTLKVVDGPNTENCPFGDWIQTLQEACYYTRIWWIKQQMHAWQQKLLKLAWAEAPNSIIVGYDDTSLVLACPSQGMVVINMNESGTKLTFEDPYNEDSLLKKHFALKYGVAKSIGRF